MKFKPVLKIGKQLLFIVSCLYLVFIIIAALLFMETNDFIRGVIYLIIPMYLLGYLTNDMVKDFREWWKQR